MKLSTVYLRAARKVAKGEDRGAYPHHTCCDALALVAPEDIHGEAYMHFCDWIGDGHRGKYWFGKHYVYEHIEPMYYDKKHAEVLANQQARIYAMLFMWRLARNGDI